MSRAQLKEVLLKEIEEADERLLKMMHALVEAYGSTDEESILGYDAQGNPKTVADMKTTLKEELEAARSGKFISLSELQNRSEKWLKGTK